MTVSRAKWLTGTAVAAAVGMIGLAMLSWPREDDASRGNAPTAAGLAAQVLGGMTDGEATAFEEQWRPSFPDDHLAHPDAASETWAVTAHLRDDDGTPVAILFSLSRVGLAADRADETMWAPQDAWTAQASLAGALTGTEARISRGAGAAGFDNAARSVWLDDWSLVHVAGAEEELFQLEARPNGVPLRLSLRPEAAPLTSPAEATDSVRGYSVPRLVVEGTIGTGPETRALSGTAWLDRLWGAASGPGVPGPGGPLVYDRMVAHFDDGSALAILRSRRRDGRGGEALDGLVMRPDGTVETLPEGGLTLTRETSEARSAWRLTGPGIDLTGDITGETAHSALGVPIRHLALGLGGTLAGRDVTGLGSFILSVEGGA